VKRLMLIVLFICACPKTQAQMNYVLNPSFEQYSHCPDFYDQIGFANGWSSTDTNWQIRDSVTAFAWCLPEYCNECSTGTSVGIPNGQDYYQYARTGKGMALARFLLEPSSSYSDYRDYVQGRLSKTLTGRKSYCVTFYVNLTEMSEYAINNIGAYLDDGSIDVGQDSLSCAMLYNRYTPQVFETTIINDTLNWVKVQGSFVANGTERFITIGNFFDYAHTNKILRVNTAEATFYLIDDISVIESDAVADAGPDKLIGYGDTVLIGLTDSNTAGMPCYWYVQGGTTPIDSGGSIRVHPDTTTSYVVEMDLCGNITKDTVSVFVATAGIKPLTPKGEPSVFPNPARDYFTVENAKGCEVLVYDVVGLARLTMNITDDTEQVGISGLANGVYNVVITDPITKVRTARKLVKAQ